jgi:hypothetical protein
MATIPVTKRGADQSSRKSCTAQDGRASGRHQRHCRSARPGRPERKRRIRRRQGPPGLHRRPHCRDRRQAVGRADHRPVGGGCRGPRGVRRHGGAGRRKSGEAVTYQIVGEDEADLKLGLINISQPDCPRPDRQGRGRRGRGAGAGRRQALRDRGRALPLMATMQAWCERWPLLLAALWWGGLSGLSFVAVPMAFAFFGNPAVAGPFAAKLFQVQAWFSVFAALACCCGGAYSVHTARSDGTLGLAALVAAGRLAACCRSTPWPNASSRPAAQAATCACGTAWAAG